MHKIEMLKYFQSSLGSGTRVETVSGKWGIIDSCSKEEDMCKVALGFGKFEECKLSHCRILSMEEARTIL